MNQIYNTGNMPEFLKIFLTKMQFTAEKSTDVFECTDAEIYNRAKEEKSEPQVLIDKKHGRAYLCSVSASVIGDDPLSPNTKLRPSFYFAPLSDDKMRQYQRELREAREKVISDAKIKREQEKIMKENTRRAGEELREKM